MGDHALTNTKIRQTANMWDWKLVRNWRGELILTGRIFEDKTKRFVDHELIVTTPVQTLDILGDGTYIAETLNTQYVLVTKEVEEDILNEIRKKGVKNPYDQEEMDRSL